MDSSRLVAAITEAVVKRLAADGQALRPEASPRAIPVGVSNRHAHLSRDDLVTLFGGDRLTVFKELSQPGQFAGEEKLVLVGSKGVIEQVRVLGPVRGKTQVELAVSDCLRLGIEAPVRDSGDLAGSSALTLVGPAGAVTIREGVIIAARHIHMTPGQAAEFGCQDGQRMSVRAGGPRGVVFNEVLVRVSDKYSLEMHVDIDEANAVGLRNGDVVELVG